MNHAIAAIVGAVGIFNAAAHVAVTDIEIKGFAFNPVEVTVTVGTTVRWTNRDSMGHTATSQTGPGTLIQSGMFDSGLLELGDSFEFTFQAPGRYDYYCVPHGSSMQGVIHVFCTADFDRSRFVDLDDFTNFVAAFLAGTDNADVDASGYVDTDDYDFFVHAFENGC